MQINSRSKLLEFFHSLSLSLMYLAISRSNSIFSDRKRRKVLEARLERGQQAGICTCDVNGTCPILKSQTRFSRSIDPWMHSLRAQVGHTDAGNVEREIRCTGTFGYIYIQIVHYIDAETIRRKNKRIRKLMYNWSRKKDNRLHNSHWFHMCNT